MAYRNVICLGSSIPMGVGDSQNSTPTNSFGWVSRAAKGNFALMNFGCAGEAGYLWTQEPGFGSFRNEMLQLADTVLIQYGANEILDTTNGPLTLAQLQAEFNALVAYCRNMGVGRVLGVTIGQLGSGTLQSLTPGSESGQTVNAFQASTISPFDNWLVAGGSNANACFDVRNILQLGGYPGGTAGKWQTYPACLTGTVGAGSTSTTIVDSAANFETLNSSAPFPQANAGQLQFQGCIVANTHSGTTVYNYVSQTTLTVTAATLAMQNSWTTTPVAGDTYAIYPCSNNNADFTHYSPYAAKLIGANFVTWAASNGGF